MTPGLSAHAARLRTEPGDARVGPASRIGCGPTGDCGPALFPADPDRGPAFDLRPAQGEPTPLIASSPHSGRLYPAEMMALSVLDQRDIRRSEDAYVDRLVDGAPERGVPLLLARHARAYVDLNRAPYELDPGMFLGAGVRACKRTPRAAAGLGSVARVVGEGREIYGAPLDFAEVEARLARVHAPFHAALDELMAAPVARFGCAVLLDWHSMPSAAVAAGGAPGPEIVIGDRHGAAAAPAVARRVERAFQREGFAVARNRPYAGGYLIERQAHPATRRHALQVEIRRDLYLDERTLAPSAGFGPLRAALDRVLARLATQDWAAVA